MPDQPPPVMHYRNPNAPLGAAACGEQYGGRTSSPGEVTCFACRRSRLFHLHRHDPVLIGTVLKDMLGIGEPTPQPAAKNERGFYVIEEVIHHGDYRSTRYVEIPQITPLAVDCIIQTSAYGYGSWLHPENPDHKAPRNQKLHELVADLKAGRTNRVIGWSTFRTINPEENP